MSCIFPIDGNPVAPLSIVLCPCGGKCLKGELAELKMGGIQTLVSMLGKAEAEMLGLGEEGRLAEEIGLQFLSFPVPDTHVPPAPSAFRQFVKELASRLRAGERIGVHCRGSIGRATVTAACTLIELGWPPSRALAAIEAARGCPVPDTDEQESWILNYRKQP